MTCTDGQEAERGLYECSLFDCPSLGNTFESAPYLRNPLKDFH